MGIRDGRPGSFFVQGLLVFRDSSFILDEWTTASPFLAGRTAGLRGRQREWAWREWVRAGVAGNEPASL